MIDSARRIAKVRGATFRFFGNWKNSKRAATAVVASGLGALSMAPALAGDLGHLCIAKVLHSEELPFAPMGFWLVRVTLEITSPRSPKFVTTLQNNVPRQRSAPRRGEVFQWNCDPATLSDFQSQSPTAFWSRQ